MFQPPEDLIREWCKDRMPAEAAEAAFYLAQQAAQWGADQELDECCEHVRNFQPGFVERLDGSKWHRATDLKLSRRPTVASVKRQSLALLEQTDASEASACIRSLFHQALNFLPD